MQQAVVDQGLEVSQDGGGEGSVSEEEAQLDVSVEGGFGEVGRGQEEGLFVGYDGFGVEDSGGAFGVEGSGVEEDSGAGGSGPVGFPEAVGEAADEGVGGGGVSLPSLDVQEEGDAQGALLVHAPGEDLEGFGAVEEGVGARPDRTLGGAEELFVD